MRRAEALAPESAGGRGAPLGPRAGWACWRTMALIELMRLVREAFCAASLGGRAGDWAVVDADRAAIDVVAGGRRGRDDTEGVD